jgi:imidazolonepropionase
VPEASPQRISAIIDNAAQVLTCAADAPDGIGLEEGAVVAIAGSRVAAVGRRAAIAARHDLSGAVRIDARAGVVLPGFVDAHTHLVFHGSRVAEYALRVRGATTAEIVARGIRTGIPATVAMLKNASTEQLVLSATERLDQMLASGTTTVESKSGYGLSTAAELRMLEVNRTLDRTHSIDIVSTFLGAHGFPGDRTRDAYLDLLVEEMIPAVAASGLAEFNDVYCDEGYYTVAESRRILGTGAAYGLRIKIHTDAYSHIGGTTLAAELRAVSADHLNYTHPDEYAGLRAAGVVGVVMPGLDFAVRHSRPFAARAMLDAGVTLALATDLCPACWLESMPLVIQLACRLYGFGMEEAIRAATLNGATALGRERTVGSLEPGKQADIAIFPLPCYQDLAYRIGRGRASLVIKGGRIVYDANA